MLRSVGGRISDRHDVLVRAYPDEWEDDERQDDTKADLRSDQELIDSGSPDRHRNDNAGNDRDSSCYDSSDDGLRSGPSQCQVV